MKKGSGIKNIELVKLNRTPYYIEEFEEKPVIWDYTSGFSIDSTDTTKITKTGSNNWSSLAIARTQPIYRNDNIWQGVKNLYLGGQLPGISRICVSTKKNKKKSGVIKFYCGPYSNEQVVKEFGQCLLNKIKYLSATGYMYYKTEEQSRLKIKQKRKTLTKS